MKRILNLFKKKDEGPFKANRILDTPEVKVDQVFTKKDEKPIALLHSVTEEIAQRIGAEGYAGPTSFGAKGEYDRGKRWVTGGFYYPENIPGARLTMNISGQIISAVRAGPGTIVPHNINFEGIRQEKEIPISEGGYLRTNYRGYTELKGKFNVSGPIMKMKQNQEVILNFLYKESQHDLNWITVGRIRDGTGLTDTEIQEGLTVLNENDLVIVLYREKNHGIIDAKITDKGRKKFII